MTLRNAAVLSLLAIASVVATPACAQKAVASADAAADAFVDALARHDGDALKALVGADYRKYTSYQGINADDVTNFSAGWAAGHKIVTLDPNTAAIELSVDGGCPCRS
jgi:hypothetical protein